MMPADAKAVFDALQRGENAPALTIAALLRWIRNEHMRLAYEAERNRTHEKLWGDRR